jgi:hypothetical protein
MSAKQEKEGMAQGSGLLVVMLVVSGVCLGIYGNFNQERKPKLQRVREGVPIPPGQPVGEPTVPGGTANRLTAAPADGRVAFGGYRLKLPPKWNVVEGSGANQLLAAPAGTGNITASLVVQRIPVKSLSAGWSVVGEWERGHHLLAGGTVNRVSPEMECRWVDLLSPPAHVEAFAQFLDGKTEVAPFPQRRMYVLTRQGNEVVAVNLVTTDPGRGPETGLTMGQLVEIASSITGN